MTATLLLILLLGFTSLAGGVLWLRVRRQLRQALLDSEQVRDKLARGYEAQRQLESEQAASSERDRIFRDLHDDLGAKLLTLIHTSADQEQADLARSVLQDFRDILSRSTDASGSVLEVLAQIRDETEQRLFLAGVGLEWHQAADLPDPLLDSAQALHLFRIVREATSNALRHAQPSALRVRARAHDDLLVLDVTDDGVAAPEAGGLGRGMVNMRRRAAELHGSIDWASGTLGGTKVVLRFPLPRAV